MIVDRLFEAMNIDAHPADIAMFLFLGGVVIYSLWLMFGDINPRK